MTEESSPSKTPKTSDTSPETLEIRVHEDVSVEEKVN